MRISTPLDPLPSQLTDAQLIDEVTRATGRVIIGIKPAGAPRSGETGVVPAIDRSTALAGRAEVAALGAQILMTFRHSSAVVATIAPNLAPVLRSLPTVDYVEASFPGAVQAQDTSWGVKRVSAHLVWPGWYGLATRGEGVFVTILDGGVDESHRWSLAGDGPENLNLDCYWIAGRKRFFQCFVKQLIQMCYRGWTRFFAYFSG